ncbi:MAG: DUF4330 family protein [Ruminococcaceae bacterium]|nr:DUF4330 family protein [Oscillospiraceae bacterium]
MRNGKRKAGFLDLLLLLLILFAALGIFLRWNSIRSASEGEGTEEYHVSAVVVGVDPRVFATIGAGETLYTVSGDAFGKIIFLEKRPSEMVLVQNGVCYRGEGDPALRCDILIELSIFGNEREGRLLRDGRTVLSIGQNLTLYTERAELHLCILNYLKKSEPDAISVKK